MKGKKAQITIFIIIGIVVLIVFILLMYMQSLKTKGNINTGVEQTAVSKFNIDILKAAVSSCLETSLKNGLKILGEQGGYFYEGQDGYVSPKAYQNVSYLNENLTYLIAPEDNVVPPYYPCSENWQTCYFVMNKTLFPNIDHYSFGKFRMLPRLGKYFTKNGELFELNLSIQGELENYTLIKTVECFQNIIKKPEFNNLNITGGNATIEIAFGENDVISILDYPITVGTASTGPETNIFRFNAKTNLRFRKIWDAVDEIIRDDVLYLDYNIITDSENGMYDSPYYMVKEGLQKFNQIKGQASIKRIPIFEHDDIIIINDSGSNLFGEPYVFKFVRKNRYPVLNYINDTSNISGIIPQLRINATDPDEDNINYYSSFGSDIDSNTLIPGIPDPNTLVSQPISAGNYRLRIYASDGEYEDYQDVNIIMCDGMTDGNSCRKECGAAIGADYKQCTNCLDPSTCLLS